MSEEQFEFLSDKEYDELKVFEQTLLTDKSLFGQYSRAYMEDRGGMESFLRWAWKHRKKE